MDAAVQYTPADVNIGHDVAEGEVTDYQVHLNGDGMREFDIQVFDTITKVADIDATATATGVLRDDAGVTANLPAGSIIGPAQSGSFLNSGPDRLSGINPDKPDGNFQVSDGPGYIGVEFLIDGNIHYGYVGYEGTGEEGSPNGHIYALGFEDVPNTAILAGAGVPVLTADVDMDGDVDGDDFLAIQAGQGSEYDQDDVTAFREQFGQGGAPAGVTASATPEPGSLALLAAGAAGITLYRRRRSS